MSISTTRKQINDEIKLVPAHKLSELYHLVHHFRLQSECASNAIDQIMAFAGCWQNMPEDEFEEFCLEVAERREASSARRQHLDACDG